MAPQGFDRAKVREEGDEELRERRVVAGAAPAPPPGPALDRGDVAHRVALLPNLRDGKLANGLEVSRPLVLRGEVRVRGGVRLQGESHGGR